MLRKGTKNSTVMIKDDTRSLDYPQVALRVERLQDLHASLYLDYKYKDNK